MTLWLSVIGVVVVIAIATWWTVRERIDTPEAPPDAARDSLPNDQLGL